MRHLFNASLTMILISLSAQAGEIGNITTDLNQLKTVVSSGTLIGMLAKELCSCRFVEHVSLQACEASAPIPSGILSSIALIKEDDQHGTMTVSLQPDILADNYVGTAKAALSSNPNFGCQMISTETHIYSPADDRRNPGY